VCDQRPSETSPRVLIADDNGDTREMHALYLNMEAILKARALRPDLAGVGSHLLKLRGNRATSAL